MPNFDARITARQEGSQRTIRKLSRQIRAGLITDRKRMAEGSGSTIDSIIVSDPTLVIEAWVRMQGWYKDAAERPPPPPVAYISGDLGGGMYGTLRPRPSVREAYSHQGGPLTHGLYFPRGGGYC